MNHFLKSRPGLMLILCLSFCFSIGYAQRLQAIDKAEMLYNEEKWEELRPLANALALENPINGKYWYWLGRAHYTLGDMKEAINAFRQSEGLGYRQGRAIKYIAKAMLAEGRNEEALPWVRRGLSSPKSIYLDDIKTDSLFAPILSQLKAEGYLLESQTGDRILWESDIKWLKERFEQIHIDLYGKVSKASWESDFDHLNAEVENMTDYQILLKIMKITARVGDGHTFVRPPIHGKLKLHYFPLKLFEFENQVHLIATSPNYEIALGSRLIAIDGRPIEQIKSVMEETVSVDNSQTLLDRYEYLFVFPELLEAAGLIDSSERAHFEFESPSGETISLEVQASDFNPAALSAVLGSKAETVPLYRINSGNFFWRQPLSDLNAMYVKINLNLDSPDMSMEQFYSEMFDEMDQKALSRLIIDIRDCPGGNSFNNKALIEGILSSKSIDMEEGLMTIIGRKTFSAAMNLASDLEQWTHTRFIGEPTGSSPNFVGETNFVTLPSSGLQVSISNAFWQRSVSWDERVWIAPDIYIPPSLDDLREGSDGVMEYIYDVWSSD